jgi:hypothetical protein
MMKNWKTNWRMMMKMRIIAELLFRGIVFNLSLILQDTIMLKTSWKKHHSEKSKKQEILIFELIVPQNMSIWELIAQFMEVDQYVALFK